MCTYPKYGNFAGNGCAGGGGVLYSDRQSHTRGAPQGAPRCFFLGGVCTCRAGPMCPAAGYAFFGGARGPRPTGRYVEPRVGDGVPDVPFRAVLFCLVGADDSVRPNSAAALSLRGAPQGYLLRGAQRRGNPFPFHKSPPKSQQFPTKFCAPIQNMEISPETVAQGAEECYILTANRIRAAPMGAGFFSYIYIFRKRITGRLRNKF